MGDKLEGILLALSLNKLTIKESMVKIDELYSKPDETIKDRQLAFTENLRPYIEEYGREMLNDFYRFWATPKTPRARLLPFEKQKSFDLKLRLKTWAKRKQNYSIVKLLRK